MLRRALILCLLAGLPCAAWSAPIRRTLGQYPLPNAKGEERFQSGFFRIGHFFQNNDSAAAARPDGSGTAYNLYQVHIHDAFQEGKGGFIADTVFLSDRELTNNFKVTEFGYLLGFVLRGDGSRLQFNREEHKPVDRGGRSYRYWDMRASFDFDTGGNDTRYARKLNLGTLNKRQPYFRRLRGVLTIGYFIHNNTYYARTDLTGNAKLRYHGRAELTLRQGLLVLGEAGLLTDEHRALRPVSMEASYGIGWKAGPARVSLLRVINEDFDRPGFYPYFVLQFTYPFDSRK